jgi:hypothetical protein
MANKLAGQRAKFSRQRAIYYTTNDDAQRQRAIRLMAEVLADAPASGFSEEQVTQGEEVPDEVRLPHDVQPASVAAEDADQLVEDLQETVDSAGALETGEGGEFVYAYGYRCAPDRLKIGSCAGDPVARIAAQISTGTPDRPVLHLLIRTHDCRALERTLHGILRLHSKKVAGAGAEWFISTRDEVLAAYRRIMDPLPVNQLAAKTFDVLS